MKTHIVIEGILAWINMTPISEIEQLASTDTPVRDKILAQYPLKYKPVADLLLGAQGRKYLADMGENDFTVVIDEALRRFPAKGLILWKYKNWTIHNIKAIVTEYLSLK